LPPPPESVPYRIGPSDELTIRVLPEPTIEREVVVQPDGSFVFDLIGEVKASGRTPEHVGQEIERRIAEYRQNPSASVALDRAASSSVTVLGEVETRGVYPVERSLRVTDAIARAGGPTQLAAASRVRLIRREGSQSTTYLANLDRIHEGDLATDYLVVAGDMIYVPPSSTVSFGYALGRALYPLEVVARIFLAPFIGLAGANN
jgi:polysaccharide export outer membrane protein